MKNDGSFEINGNISPLQKIMLNRRSFRKYSEGEVPDEKIDYILRSAEAFRNKAGFSAARLMIPGSEDRKRIIRAAMKGLVGKINPWLPFAKSSHLLLCGAVYPSSKDRAGIENALKQASMTMQAALLAATEVNLATCWLAGINHAKIEEVFEMPDRAKIIAMSPLGFPPLKKGLSWDAMVYHLTSKKRKPLHEIRMNEHWDP